MSISRRGFLKIAGIGGAGAIAGAALPAAASESDFEGYPDRYGMLTDVSKCIGCRSCEAACNKQNKLPKPETPFEDLSVLDTKRRTTAQAYTVVNKYNTRGSSEPAFRKLQCNHCNEPACVSACFVKALTKTKEGPVLWNDKLCVGCRYCMIACPFYIPTYEYDNAFSPRVMKCTMCADKVAKGDGAPACAEACPTEAITFGKRSDLMALARERIRTAPDKYIDHIYGETEVGGLGWVYISHVPFDDVGLPTNLGGTPYPKFTKNALAAVPMIVVLWPVVLGGVYAFARRREAIDKQTRENAVANAVETTRADTQAKADQAREAALKRAASQAENEKKKAVKEAVDKALEEAKQQQSGEAPKEGGA